MAGLPELHPEPCHLHRLQPLLQTGLQEDYLLLFSLGLKGTVQRDFKGQSSQRRNPVKSEPLWSDSISGDGVLWSAGWWQKRETDFERLKAYTVKLFSFRLSTVHTVKLFSFRLSTVYTVKLFSFRLSTVYTVKLFSFRLSTVYSTLKIYLGQYGASDNHSVQHPKLCPAVLWGQEWLTVIVSGLSFTVSW